MRGLAYPELVQTGAAFRRRSVRGTDSSDRDAGLYKRKTIAFFEKRMACRSGFCRGCDSDNNHDTAPQQNRSGAGAALCWERIGLRIGWNTLHRSFVSGRYFKKTESSGVCDFCCDAGTLYSADANKSGKECTFPRIYAKGYRFCTAHEHALRPGRAALFTGCSCPNLQELRSGRKQKGDPACGWPCRSALAGAYSAACCLLFFTEDGNHAGGKPDLDLVETVCIAAGAALCGGMAGRRREKGKIRVKSYYLRESGLTNRPIACILYKNVSVPMAQRRISLCKEVPKGCE